MRARQHKWGSLLPNREDTDGVRPTPLLRWLAHPVSILELTKNEVVGGWRHWPAGHADEWVVPSGSHLFRTVDGTIYSKFLQACT